MKKIAIYSNEKRKIRTNFIENSENFPLTLFIDNELFNYEKSFVAGTDRLQEKIIKNLENINITNPLNV